MIGILDIDTVLMSTLLIRDTVIVDLSNVRAYFIQIRMYILHETGAVLMSKLSVLIVELRTISIYSIFLWVTVMAANLTGRYICDRIFHNN